MRHGDFTGLAENYSKFRPSYAPSALTTLLALAPVPAHQLDAADVGAGTGIWTRLLAERVRSVVAVEPNDDMRAAGIRDCAGLPIRFQAGSGEAPGLADGSAAMLTMASSFHWVDYDQAMAAFHRALVPGGRFVAVWNPRRIVGNPLFEAIEAKQRDIQPALKRVSSGDSDFTAGLFDRLAATPGWSDPVYVEAIHSVRRSREEYIGAWKSVNDVRVQLGPDGWAQFLAFLDEILADHPTLDVVYTTRAWTVRRD